MKSFFAILPLRGGSFRPRGGSSSTASSGRGPAWAVIRNDRNDRGFTLLEVTVAAAIFAVTLTAFPALLVSTVQANARAGEITVATSLAQDKLEELSLVPIADLASGADPTPLGADGQPDVQGLYSRSWTVAAGPTGPTSRRVTVSIGWRGRNVGPVALSTIFGT